MKLLSNKTFWVLAILLSGYAYIGSCTHKNEDILARPTQIVRGTDAMTVGVDKWKLDKSHSSVLWETVYLGQSGLLTGRFNNFGVTNLNFNESDPANISFEGWVWLNTVNTGEVGRDASCLLGTFGTALGKTTEAENIAKIVTKKVELSKTDPGYIVTFDMTFLGKTKEYVGKLSYIKKQLVVPATGSPYHVFGLRFEFQFLSKTDFGLVSSNVSDKAGIVCNMNFNNK